MIPRPTVYDARVEQVCRSWEGTPYKLNRGRKKIGVDCLHFGASVLDELYGSEHSRDLNSLPPDACVHNKKGVIAAARALFTKYPAMERVQDGSVEAGDIIFFGRAAALSSTQHLMVAGSPGRLWHATSPSVHCTGIALPTGLKFICSYRAADREKWEC